MQISALHNVSPVKLTDQWSPILKCPNDMSKYTLQNNIAGGELAPGWRVEVKTRNSGTSAGTNDAVSLQPACVLRSVHCRACAENAMLDSNACLLVMLPIHFSAANSNCMGWLLIQHVQVQYYFDPAGQRFRSRQDVVRHLEIAAGKANVLSRSEAAANARSSEDASLMPLVLDNGVTVLG